MKCTIDFKECLKDSPKFRASLEESEQDVDNLECRLERLVKLCTAMIDTGKTFSTATGGFIVGVRDLASYFHDDNLTSSSLNRFAHAMSEMLKYFTILMDQAHRSVCKNLNNFIKNDIKKVKEMKKHFEKISDDMDGALIRNSQAPRTKTQECEEAHNVLTAMKSCFAHTSLDYVFQLNVLHSKKKFEVLDTMLSFMHAQNTFFHQGDDLFVDLEPYMKDIAAQVEELSTKAKEERKEMEGRHTLVQQKELLGSDSSKVEKEGPDIEGYLFRRTSNAFRTWVRRWFIVENRQLTYRKRSKDSLTVMEDDLRLCSVKPVIEIDRRFCFEVMSPTRNHVMQADSDADCQFWISAIQQSINRAYRETMHAQESLDEQESSTSNGGNADTENGNPSPAPQPKQSKSQIRLTQLMSIPGNDVCCDCRSPQPCWASINLGIILCIECSGIHRSFGVHLSKVRSVMLDAWEPELVKVMAELGNDVINRVYEAHVDETIATRATPDCNRCVREAWIRAKYVDKSFVSRLPGPKNQTGNKIRSWSVRKKTKKSLQSIVKEDSKEDVISQSDSDDVTSGLMEAVLSVSSICTKDSDSGLGSSSPDVLVFGTDIQSVADFNKSLDFESSEDSSTETDDCEDRKSTTSWEDMSKLDPNMLLYKATEARNLPVMLEALAHGADPNWVNIDDDNKTPIMKAVETGSLSACEFLLLNGAKLDRTDCHNRTPLHHATMLGHTGQVCQFLKRGANQNANDDEGRDPLKIAVESANADIVTLLRLSKLNEEMKEADGYSGNPSDETFQDVFRDFTNMASNNPEKLKRK
ncbi:arf-GAP with coiled-coil, ANK repeat and PH domain-containing protein 2-like isoform X2 [Gigantopelta aegis]|uniref:arf-GAP with coiled-coil, ANK repeat and PH domain-containing protein 2-like isoform X2 n=1 Tax=Gigantopelta aegis TaxID=1735272 RepID=UPI001B88DE26|nr:arf-GAP with coiled-coil, ANK repeat and PH domain-containing protein 2-like isoform X2 [Gigantopelta aegis]